MKPPTVVVGPVYHATLHTEIGAYHPGTHFGTKAAAEHRLKAVLELSAERRTSFVVSLEDAIPTMHAVHLDICKPFDMEDPGEWWPEHYAAAMRAAGHPVSQEDLARVGRRRRQPTRAPGTTWI